ncbi:MAG: glutathione S-transferase [Parasphingorhabdus sp.]
MFALSAFAASNRILKMILIGQFDSPFVRRTAVTMNYYGIPFERKILSVFTDFEKMLDQNPLGKVPILVLDNGECIFDSRMIIDYVERLVSEKERLIPAELDHRCSVLRVEAVALGLAEKSYERGLEYARRQPDKIDENWSERLKRQITSALAWLESQQPDPWLYGDRMTQADITCAVAYTYLREKQQIAFSSSDFPTLDEHSNYCESLQAFKLSAYSALEATNSGWQPKSSLDV